MRTVLCAAVPRKYARQSRLGVIGERARIDEELDAAHRERERERVGVAVRRDLAVAERPGVGDEADLVAASRSRSRGCSSRPRGSARRTGSARALRVAARRTPRRRRGPSSQRVLSSSAPALRLEVAAAKSIAPVASSERKRQKPVARIEAHHVAVVGIAEHRHVAAHVHDRGEELQHRLERARVGRAGSRRRWRAPASSGSSSRSKRRTAGTRSPARGSRRRARSAAAPRARGSRAPRARHCVGARPVRPGERRR